MVNIGGKTYRNLQEQVGYNSEQIKEIFSILDGIDYEDHVVVIENISTPLTEDEMAIVNEPVAFLVYQNKLYFKDSSDSDKLYFSAVIDIDGTDVVTIISHQISVKILDGELEDIERTSNLYSSNEIDIKVSNLESLISGLASGSPRGVYATLLDLQTAYPTGSDGIYLVTADGHWYYWDGVAWTDGGTYMTSLPDKYLDTTSNNSVENQVVSKSIDDISSHFEPSNINLFNKYNYLIEKGVYLNGSNQFVAFASSMIITIKIDGVIGDKFAFNNFNGAFASFTLTGLKLYTSNNVPSVNDPSFVQDMTANTNISVKRGFGTLSSDATYLNIQYLFSSTSDMADNIQNIVDGLMLVVGDTYASTYHSYYNTIQESLLGDSIWKNKTIWWCGTSIPAGVDPNSSSPFYQKSYPEIVGLLVKAKAVYNKSLGSSMCRANVRTGDYVDALSYNVMYSLSQTAEEKQDLIDNWQTIRQSLIDPNTFPTLDATQQAIIHDATFEEKLLPYLDGTYEMPDLFVIDHGHNDFKTYYSLPNGDPDIELEPTVDNIQNGILAEDTYMTSNNYYNLKRFLGDLTHIPPDRFDEFIASINRNCYKGAINFICTVILYHNPRARIVFIGNIESWQKEGLTDAQENNANSWQFPLVKVWEYLGLSHHIVPDSYNYWGGANTTDYDVKQIYCKDNIHPHSDTSGEALEKCAFIIADKLKHIAV